MQLRKQSSTNMKDYLIKCMINYELLKQLKDAEFPLIKSSLADQKFGLKIFHHGKDDVGRDNAGWLEPTLSELINACGKLLKGNKRIVLNVLHIGEKREYAFIRYDDLDSGKPKTEEILDDSKTPEEAVARLFLKMKKHGQIL